MNRKLTPVEIDNPGIRVVAEIEADIVALAVCFNKKWFYGGYEQLKEIQAELEEERQKSIDLKYY